MKEDAEYKSTREWVDKEATLPRVHKNRLLKTAHTLLSDGMGQPSTRQGSLCSHSGQHGDSHCIPVNAVTHIPENISILAFTSGTCSIFAAEPGAF